MFESAVNGKLEREAANAFVSAALSGWMSFIWQLGARNMLGLGPALRDMATAQYLTLSRMETKNFLALTVNKDMLTPDNLARFQTEWKEK